MDAVLARFVAGGGDDAALIGTASHDDGLAVEFGAFEQLNGNEKRVRVHVKDGRSPEGRRVFRWTMLRSETREVRHEGSVPQSRNCYKLPAARTPGMRRRSSVTQKVAQGAASL